MKKIKAKKERKLSKTSNCTKALFTVAGILIVGTGVSYFMDLRAESTATAEIPEIVDDTIETIVEPADTIV